MLPARATFDAGLGRFTEEAEAVEALEAQLREVEFEAMAKVWAYPDDMPALVHVSVGAAGQRDAWGAAASGGGGGGGARAWRGC